jgi:pimeloyl-ACP methyl ester carboxylesterase
VEPQPGAIVLCGGAMGGLLGPGDALYHRLGVEWSARGVPVLRVSYRKPNDLDQCCVDVAAAVQLAIGGAGADRVVLMGHSFGGAVAVRVGVGLHEMVSGVVTFATQSAGCELAAGLQGTPLLLFHGDRDEILPIHASEMVQMIAGSGELVRLPGDGHLLAKSDAAIWDRLESFLPALVLRT